MRICAGRNPDRGECQLPDAFYRIKKYYSTLVNLQRDFPKMDFFGI